MINKINMVEATTLKAKADEELEKALPYIKQCAEAIKQLTPKGIMELRSYP